MAGTFDGTTVSRQIECHKVSAQIFHVAAQLRLKGKDPTAILAGEYSAGLSTTRPMAFPWIAFALEVRALVGGGLLGELRTYLAALQSGLKSGSAMPDVKGMIPRSIGQGNVVKAQRTAFHIYRTAPRIPKIDKDGFVPDIQAMVAGGATEQLTALDKKYQRAAGKTAFSLRGFPVVPGTFRMG